MHRVLQKEVRSTCQCAAACGGTRWHQAACGGVLQHAVACGGMRWHASHRRWGVRKFSKGYKSGKTQNRTQRNASPDTPQR